MSNFVKNTGRYLIKTPSGYEHFEGVQKKYTKSLYTFTFEDGTLIKCSGKHRFLTDKGFLVAENITKDHTLSNKNIKSIDIEYGSFEVYDPVGVDKHSTYLSHGVVSHNTEFIGSASTLVSGVKLRNLTFFNPIYSEENLDIYEEPIKGHMYIATVDCSEGVGADHSTVNIIDVTQQPYRQVAKYRNNKIPLMFLPNVVYHIGTKYNEAFVLVETNSIGQQVVDILHYDLEYDNIFKLEQHNIKGTTISAGFKRSASLGIKTTKSVKKIGCANLKTLIESDKLIVNDFDTIAELNTFVRVRDSYAADAGHNDDLVMGLVLFSWLTAQSYFKDTTNIDIRKILLNEQAQFLEDNMTPFGFIDNGLDDGITIDGNDTWHNTMYIPVF